MRACAPGLIGLLLLALASCAPAPPEPTTRAGRLAAMRPVNIDEALKGFGKVCDASAPGFADTEARWKKLRDGRNFIFETNTGKSPFCTMTARAGDTDQIWRMMLLRFGVPKHIGGTLFVFNREGRYPLVYEVNCKARGCPEPGTFKFAILPGRKF